MQAWLKGVGAVLLIAGYALASHFALILPNGRSIAALLALGIPAGALAAVAFRWLLPRVSRLMNNQQAARLVAVLAATLPVALVLWAAWPLVVSNTEALYFVQHVGTNALLAWVFGQSLLPGSTPLIVTFARVVHPDLPIEMEAYARKVTAAWTLFFIATCALSAMLFWWAPLALWSTFAVLLQWPSVAAFFVGEYALRRYLFRGFAHASLRQGFDAYQAHQQPGRANPATSAASKLAP
jgi:uncharacterized membrane protein